MPFLCSEEVLNRVDNDFIFMLIGMEVKAATLIIYIKVRGKSL